MNLSQIELPSNRKFGFFFTAVFLFCFLYFYFFGNSFWSYLFLSFGTAFLIITIFFVDLLLPLNRLWMSIGLILGIIISPIVSGAIFFIIFVPVALFLRLLGRDELNLRLSNKKSLWINRKLDSRSGSFRQQF